LYKSANRADSMADSSFSPRPAWRQTLCARSQPKSHRTLTDTAHRGAPISSHTQTTVCQLDLYQLRPRHCATLTRP
jgi:hypothetical protein